MSAFGIITVLIVTIMMITFDFTSLNIDVKNNIVNITAPVYGMSFEKNEIEELELVDNIDVTFRTNGVGAESYSLGDFTVKDYGSARLFVYSRDDSPYIYMKVNGKNIFIKGETKEDTDKYYNELKS